MKKIPLELNDKIYSLAHIIEKAGKEVIFKKHNLTIQRYKILKILHNAQNKNLLTTQIQKSLNVSSGNMTGRIDGLEKLELVKRIKLDKDRRNYFIKLTKKGEMKYLNVEHDYTKSIEELYQGIKIEDLKTTHKTIDTIYSRLDNFMKTGKKHNEN